MWLLIFCLATLAFSCKDNFGCFGTEKITIVLLIMYVNMCVLIVLLLRCLGCFCTIMCLALCSIQCRFVFCSRNHKNYRNDDKCEVTTTVVKSSQHMYHINLRTIKCIPKPAINHFDNLHFQYRTYLIPIQNIGRQTVLETLVVFESSSCCLLVQ